MRGMVLVNDGQLFTWDALASMAGSSLLVYFVVQYTKGLIDRITKWLPTDIYAVIVAWIVLILAQLAVDNSAVSDWRVYTLALANAFLVAAAAGQMQHKALNPPGANNTKEEITNESMD